MRGKSTLWVVHPKVRVQSHETGQRRFPRRQVIVDFGTTSEEVALVTRKPRKRRPPRKTHGSVQTSPHSMTLDATDKQNGQDDVAAPVKQEPKPVRSRALRQSLLAKLMGFTEKPVSRPNHFLIQAFGYGLEDRVAKLENDQGSVKSIRTRTLGSDPDIVKRRTIVMRNPSLPARGLCEIFDERHIPLTKTLKEAGSWARAYKASVSRHAIDALIARDRKAMGGDRRS